MSGSVDPAVAANAAGDAAMDAACYRHLVELGIEFSAERDIDRLLERTLLAAKQITGADGGTIYRVVEDDRSAAEIQAAVPRRDRLAFAMVRNDTLNLAMGGSTGVPIPFPPLYLYDQETAAARYDGVATYVALEKHTIVIDDAYDPDWVATGAFDFSRSKAFDAAHGYRSRSFLTVALRNHAGDVIGVLQLVNARPPNGRAGQVVPFAPSLVPLVEALSSQAAVALDNSQLIAAQRRLFKAFIDLLVDALDAKSPYTGNHCKRVPILMRMLAEAACRATTGPFADFDLSDEEWYELDVAAGLHDIGKVATPVHVMDKATKLETLHDRINDVRTRIEVLKRDAEIRFWRRLAEERVGAAERRVMEAALQAELAELDRQYAFLAEINVGGEFVLDGKVADMRRIGAQSLRIAGMEQPLLSADEQDNLAIRRGTLNDAERQIMEDHMQLTIRMLEQLPFPKGMRRVPEIAGGHHERMDGTGYPRGLKSHEMSTLARMMGVADIFEGLTAADRPYKPAKTLSESLRIMSFMRQDNHIDPDIFALLLESGVYREYAASHLMPEQRDAVDIRACLAPIRARG